MDATREIGVPRGSVRDGLQYSGVALVAGDDAVKLFEVVGFGDGDGELLDFDRTGVAPRTCGLSSFRVLLRT